MQLLNRKLVHVALIIAIGLAVYSNTLHAPFYWDDANFTDSPLIKSFHYFIHPDSAQGLRGYGGFISRYFGYLSFALNYRFNGLDVTGYHLVNISIHLMSSLLVYRLVSLTFLTPYFKEEGDHGATQDRAGFVALLTALLFVAHPIQTQAVTYIVQRFAALATMFYLLSLTSYLKARVMLSGPEKRSLASLAWFTVALASAFLALKTKEIAFTLPVVVLLFEFLFFTRDGRARAAVLALSVVPFLALAATRVSGGSLAEIASNLDQATRLQTDMSRWDYLATQCRVILTYLRLLVLPVGQRLDYDIPLYDSFLHPAVLVSGALLCLMLGTACWFLKRSKPGDKESAPLLRVSALGIFWFFVTISVESSVIPIVDVIFEHRVYLPSVGLFMAGAACLSLLGGASKSMPGWPSLPIAGGCLVVLLALSGATYARNRLWGDAAAFWEDNAWKCPRKARVFVNLARARERNGDREGAQDAYRTASSLDPEQTDPLLDLGLIAIRMGKLDEALAQFRAALAIDPQLVEAHNNIGQVYGMQSRYEEALQEFQQVVQLKPALAEPHNNLGAVYALRLRYAEAIAEYAQCLALDPDYEKAYLNRGMALLAIGRRSEAHADFRRALRINPSNAEATQQLRLAGSAP